MPAPPALFDALIDYAGLFPPAKLPMTDAVRNHAAYLHGPHASCLGRFVVPLARLAEFEAAYLLLSQRDRAGWTLSVLAGNDPAADSATIAAYNVRHPSAQIVSVETKAATPADVPRVCAGLPAELEVWVEVPAAGDVEPFFQAIKAESLRRAQTGRWASVSIPTPVVDLSCCSLQRTQGQSRSLRCGWEIGDHPKTKIQIGAKIRTGGVVPEAFPAAVAIARFLTACRDAGVVCKATAGLHHPLRGEFPLTYDAGSPSGCMFGFLNVFLAATLVHTGGSEAEAASLLTESAAESFRASADGITWRDRSFSSAQIAAARRGLCRSFGSCSFTEPIEGLHALGWL